MSFPIRHYSPEEKQQITELRVDQLEKTVAALQKRIAELEKVVTVGGRAAGSENRPGDDIVSS